MLLSSRAFFCERSSLKHFGLILPVARIAPYDSVPNHNPAPPILGVDHCPSSTRDSSASQAIFCECFIVDRCEHRKVALGGDEHVDIIADGVFPAVSTDPRPHHSTRERHRWVGIAFPRDWCSCGKVRARWWHMLTGGLGSAVRFRELGRSLGIAPIGRE